MGSNSKIPLTHYLGLYNSDVGIVTNRPLTSKGLKDWDLSIPVAIINQKEQWTSSGLLTHDGFEGKVRFKNKSTGKHHLKLTSDGLVGYFQSGSTKEAIKLVRINKNYDEYLLKVPQDFAEFPDNSNNNLRDHIYILDNIVLKTHQSKDNVVDEFRRNVMLYIEGIPLALPISFIEVNKTIFMVEKKYKNLNNTLIKSLNDPELFSLIQKSWYDLIALIIRKDQGGDFSLENLLTDKDMNLVLTDFSKKSITSFKQWIDMNPQPEYISFLCRLCQYLHNNKSKISNNKNLPDLKDKFNKLMPISVCKKKCSSKDLFLKNR